MRTLVQRLKRLWNTPVEFYGVDRPEIQAGPWHGLLLFVVLLRTYLVQLPSMSSQGRTAVGESGGGHRHVWCARKDRRPPGTAPDHPCA
jgi:hypothetical protein